MMAGRSTGTSCPFAIVPAALGPLPLKREWRSDLFDGEAPFLASIYLGMPAVALVAMAGARWRWFWIAVAIGAMLVALGRHTPVYRIVSTLLPFLRSFRYPAKAIPVVALGWAMLAGMGFDAWRDAAWAAARAGTGARRASGFSRSPPPSR
jgi:TM2 domain-containing membrane protein YozV